jgi:hypothetical protein
MEQPPHPMLLGKDDGDYYRGNFTASTSSTAEEGDQ